MTRRTFIFFTQEDGTVKSVEVGRDWTPTTGGPKRTSEEELFGKLRADDGTDISTRKRWREYQERNGLTGAEDYKEKWKKAESERADHYTSGERYRKERTEAVARAVYQHRDRNRR